MAFQQKGAAKGGKGKAKFEFYPMKKIPALMKKSVDEKDGKVTYTPNAEKLYITKFLSEGIDSKTKTPYKSVHCKIHYVEGDQIYMPGISTPLLKVSWPPTFQTGEPEEQAAANPQGANFGGFAADDAAKEGEEPKNAAAEAKKAGGKLTLTCHIVPPTDVDENGEEEVFYTMKPETEKAVGAFSTPEVLGDFIDYMDAFDEAVIGFNYEEMKKDPVWALGRKSKQTVLESMTRSIKPKGPNQKGVVQPYTLKIKIKTDPTTGDLRKGANGTALFKYNYNFSQETYDVNNPETHKFIPITKPEEGNKYIWESITRNSLVRPIITEATQWKAGENLGISWHLNQIVIYQEGMPMSGSQAPQECAFDDEDDAPANNTNAGAKRKASEMAGADDEEGPDAKKQRK
uniref:DUF2738 protein n=1 Tax=Clandestinovirus TaxID=2831644 RepID=A0A8F8PK13_9VIRU|nr:DUF2738 protein [Clandestinovirus]